MTEFGSGFRATSRYSEKTVSSSGESAANLNFGGEARVAGSGPDRRVLRRGLDWLAVLVVYCFGLGGLVFLS